MKKPKRMVWCRHIVRDGEFPAWWWVHVRGIFDSPPSYWKFCLVETSMVKVQEVFLPYAQTQSGQTFFERFDSGNGMSMLEYKGK